MTNPRAEGAAPPHEQRSAPGPSGAENIVASSRRTSADGSKRPESSHDAILRVRDLGKCYEIYDRPVDRLKQTLYRGRRQFYREFWALRGVSFDLQPGETLGVVGRNGSGKSTLLQMIAGTLRPTNGQVQVRGRVHALLELGSGFNPEFTGRENVFLNGAVLGLSRAEVEARFDEIARFADIGQFLNQPVKTYSSGMAVRLAFAVQAVMEPDILIIDEALAVGDAAFQIKCMNSMKRLVDRGAAVLLVTHDVTTVRSFCGRAIWLHEGKLMADGLPLDVTSRYLRRLFAGEGDAASAEPSSDAVRAAAPGPLGDQPLADLEQRADLVRWGSGEVVVTGVRLHNGRPGDGTAFELGERLFIEFEAVVRQSLESPTTGLGFCFRNTKGLDIVTYTTWEAGHRFGPLQAGQRIRVRCAVDNLLAPGDYALVLAAEAVSGGARHYYDFVENAVVFSVAATRRVFSVVLPPIEEEVLLLLPPAGEEG